MIYRTLEIGSAVIAVQQGGDLSQSYGYAAARTRLRMANGAAHIQSRWQKLTTGISGNGWMPPPLLGLDTTAPLLIKCVAALAVPGTSNVITLPTSYRTGALYAPRGYAIVDGLSVDTPANMAGNVATLAAVSGAQSYGVSYWPQFTGHVDPPEAQVDAYGAAWGWTMNIEEA